jgi:hypothetical protein
VLFQGFAASPCFFRTPNYYHIGEYSSTEFSCINEAVVFILLPNVIDSIQHGRGKL